MTSCVFSLNLTNPGTFDKICFDNSSFITEFSQQVNSTDSISLFTYFSNYFDIDAVWTLITAALVFCLQTGFTFIQSSFIKPNQIQHILYKNLIGICICAIVFYIVGYSMAYGTSSFHYKDDQRFMGSENILIQDKTFKSWFFEFMYLAVATAITTGGISQRSTTVSYFVFIICFSAWIYPVIVYWCWSKHGWLSPFSYHPRPYGGLMDFAGSGVVHMVGGFSSLIGSLYLYPTSKCHCIGPKEDYAKYRNLQRGYNHLYHAFGIIFLWFGWYGFTCGRTLGATNVMQIASKVAVTTTLSAATSALSVVTFGRIVEGYWSLQHMCDGILCGLVVICSPCNVIDCGYAILIGFLGAIFYYSTIWTLKFFQVVDPMNSFAIHGIGGGVGLFASGIFAIDKNVYFGYYSHNLSLLYGASKGHRLATQIVGILVISIWTMANSALVFGLMNCCGVFRDKTEDDDEIVNEKNVVFTADKPAVQMTGMDESEEKQQFLENDKK